MPKAFTFFLAHLIFLCGNRLSVLLCSGHGNELNCSEVDERFLNTSKVVKPFLTFIDGNYDSICLWKYSPGEINPSAASLVESSMLL